MNALPANATLSTAECPPNTPAQLDASCRLPLLTLFVSAAFWLVVGSVFALIASIKFHGPGFLADCAWLTYGRARPAAWNTMLYGGAMQAGLGVALWMAVRLGGVRLAHPILAFLGARLWNLSLLIGVIAILAGASTGFEWLEMPHYASVPLFLSYGMIGVSALATIHRRLVRELYPSQWFLLAAWLWFPWLYATANLLLVVRPVRGVAQAIIAWWYAANLHGVWFGLVGLAVVFYFVPKLLERPLHSRYLALVTFWGVLLFGSWTGIPTSAPVPAWIPALSTVATVLTLVPLLATAINVLQTARGKLGGLWAHPTLRFIGFGFVAHGVAGVLGALASFPQIASITQFTWFEVALRELATYGFLMMALAGAVYYILPRLVEGCSLRPKLVQAHFWCAALGVLLHVLPLGVGGVLQGLKLHTASAAFMDVANSTLMPLRISTLGDVLLLAAHGIFLLNAGGLLWRWGKVTVSQIWRAATAPAATAEATR